MNRYAGKVRIGVVATLAVAAFAILAVATLSVSHAQLATSVWPMFHHDVAHTGLSTVDTSANNGIVKWELLPSASLDSRFYSSPAIGADGTIYVGQSYTLNPNVPSVHAYGYLDALNPDGTQKWAFGADNWMDSSPAIGADGTIYVGTESFYAGPNFSMVSWEGDLYAVNPDGTQKWAFPAGAVYSSPAIGADGTIYVGANSAYFDDTLQSWFDSGVIYAVNPDGTEKWAYSTVGPIGWSSPAIGADGTIYIGSTPVCGDYPTCSSSFNVGGGLNALNPNGTRKWVFETGNVVNSSPAIGADGTIYVGSETVCGDPPRVASVSAAASTR